MNDDLLGRHEELPYPPARTAGIDLFRLAKSKHYVPVLLEIDVTAARAALRRHQQEGDELSFTAWVVKCVAQAAGEHRRVHALRRGHRRLVVFADVDMALAVYRRLADDETDERLPMLESKGFAPPPWLLPLAFRTPFRLRKWLYWDRLLGSPRRFKETMGTVVVTSVPLVSRSGGGGWGIPIAVHPLVVAIGAIGRRPGLAGESAEPRDFLSLTVLFDHEVVDGVPVALFLKRLTQLMETAFEL